MLHRKDFALTLTWSFSLLIFIACRQSTAHVSVPALKTGESAKGVVVTAHRLASEVGLDILKEGGNAADAAVAVQFALAVVYPRAGNIGGGGFMVYRDSTGKITTLNFREKAPLKASHDMYLDSAGHVIRGLSLNGILSAGVPGTVAGLIETHERLGRLQPFSKLVEPAIRLAREGFPVTAFEAQRLNENREAFLKYNTHSTPFTSKKEWKEGDLLVQKDLARTLEAIAQSGRDGFYSGKNADLLDAFSKKHHGLITKEDLSAYKAVWQPPFVIHWRGYDLYTMDLPSSGGIVLGQILKMIDQGLIDSLGNRHIQNVHLILEAERRAYQDRAAFLGDRDFYTVPVDSIMSDSYLKMKIADFDPIHATPSQALGKDENQMHRERYETTHISIVDSSGNAVSVTTTLNNNYGSKVWVPGGGYFLNDEMDDFSVKPGEPNLFGLIGNE
ncbi:MAG TPA: gamma-glutamyltransferase, partial [Saprospiraceae bacterium]|nr:gamma-glutamyltransferase [Saprospiraceae bacterium]